MLADLEHPYARGEKHYDITFENVQAGERTSHLFRLANHHDGLVIGTGDLSELALGWATYGVGDHMSHYAVNASVPKTLISFMLRWVIDTRQFDDDVSAILQSVLDTEISPELIPGDGDKPTADSESKVGPYELQDFFLYYVLRYGYLPSKVAFLAEHAWGDVERGPWPDLIPPERRNAYPRADDQALARGLPLPLLPDQPVQALGDPERAEGRLRRLALAARRLARAHPMRARRCGSTSYAGTCPTSSSSTRVVSSGPWAGLWM